MRRIVKLASGWGIMAAGRTRRLRYSLSEMLEGAPIDPTDEEMEGPLLAPIDGQEVWAAGVTYARSKLGRLEESGDAAFYDKVFDAERPELFFKSTPDRVVGPEGRGRIRADSSWNVPEAEVAVIVSSEGDVFGYTIADDISSRSIEGENPLYLPQAKIYTGSCVMGPWIVPSQDVRPPFSVELRILRDGDVMFKATSSTTEMVRHPEELVKWLRHSLEFPNGVMLLTGTGIVPDGDVTLLDGDVVEIDVDPLGCLRHGIGL